MRKLAWLSFFAMTPWAFGWGVEGHRLVARIAEAQLTSAAQAQIVTILGPGKTLESVATWADEIRRARPETGTWHYIDIPVDERHLNMDRDCANGDCIIARIVVFRQLLSDPDANASERQEALKFLVHFIGDMHQPLHCSDNKDKGGNGVRIQMGNRPTNLHSVWDTTLLTRIGGEDQLLPEWSGESQKRAKKWSKGSVQDWAEQSHKAAQKVVYGKLPKSIPADRPVALPADYEKAADPLIREQIEKAGARLARVLNELLQ